jgi:DNA polymerase-1
MQYRRITKLYDTYIKPLYDSEDKPSLIYPDGLIHTSFNALLTTTRRLSASSPNLQNMPKHNDVWIRKFFIPKLDCKFVSVDYGQIEARILALLSQDQVLINALWNDYDIHAEWAKRIFKLYPDIVEERSITDKVVFKKLRDRMKNKFVFPSCFGASVFSIAESLNVPVEIIKRLQKEFWNQLKGVRMWQRELERFYAEHNYVENYFGFRRYAPLSYNELINAPIQGTASDIVINAMNVLSEYARQTNQPQFQAEINVHDDLMFSIPLTSLEKDIDVVVQKMLNTYPEILAQIPITVEVSVGDNWAEMKEIGTYSSKDL